MRDLVRCPSCGGDKLSTGTDATETIVAVAVVCRTCRYVQTSVVDLEPEVSP